MLYHYLQSYIAHPSLKFYLTLIAGLLLACTRLFAASPADLHFAVSGACRSCHDNIYDADSNDVSIGNDWKTGMMANASRDPYWIAKVAAEISRNPRLGELLNDTCSRCHAPMANDAAKKEDDPVQLFGSGFLNEQNDYHEYALDGVSCTVCHQITTDDLGTPDGFSGNFTIEEYLTTPALRPAYGQFTAPLSGGMVNQSQFTPVYSTHIQDSSLCATCHNLKTPFVDADSNPASTSPESEFPEQMVFTEWQNSDYQAGGSREQHCQECHMPRVDTPVRISNSPGHSPLRDGFSRHLFLGANTVMMDILKQNALAPGVTDAEFAQAIDRNRAFLAQAASLEILSATIINDRLELTLKVINNTGHKLPTSYPSRRAYLHFLVRTADGQTTLFESGKTNANGSIVGVETDSNPASYEPHYELIENEEQVQVYEPIMQNTDAQVTHTLLRAQSYKKDNRLTPAGFDKAGVPSDVAVRGAAASDDNFNLGSDTIHYSVALAGQQDIRVEIHLNYQALSYGHLKDLFDDSSNVSEVAEFESYFQNANIRYETLASAYWASQGTETGSFFVIPKKDGGVAIIPL